LFLTLFSERARGSPQYFQHLWQTEEGLPQNAITAIVQTRDGYLWLGTYGGLVRFDGVRFARFDSSTTPELRSSRITSLYEDLEGTLWIGNETGELTRYKNGSFEAFGAENRGKAKKVFAMASDESNDLWVLDEDGLLKRARDGTTLSPAIGAAPGQMSFAVDANRHIWVAREGKLSTVEGGRLRAMEFPGDATNSYVQGICSSRDGGLWVASDGRLRKWKQEAWTQDLGAAPWGFAGLTQFAETSEGYLAGGTVDSGLHLVVPGDGILQFNRTNGFLPQNWVRCMCEDREGNLWIGAGSGGLVVLRQAKVLLANPPDHWQGRAVLSVFAKTESDIWVGTEGAGAYHLKEGHWDQFTEPAGISNLYVWAVEADAYGKVWAGTWGGGIYLQSGDRFEPVPGLEKFRSPMPAIFHGSNHVTWIGSDEGLIRYEQGKIVSYGEREGLELPHVRTVAQGADGTIWFGMFGGGLGHLEQGKLRQFRRKDGLASDFVQCLKIEPAGTIWIGTAGGGLCRLKNNRFAGISKAHGLADDLICDIEEDLQGFFWMSSHGGIMRVSKSELNAAADGSTNRLNCLTYGKGEGMPTLECSGGLQPAGCQTPDGKIWFPTSKGLVGVDPKDVKRNLLAPPVIIEEFRVDDKAKLPETTATGGKGQPKTASRADLRFEVPPGRHRFDFNFTGLSFTVPEKVRFKYRLTPLDSDWQDGSTKRSVTYNYLPPGDYTFRVIACNNDEVWNETGAVASVRVLPWFWQTLWFRVGTALLAATALSALVLVVTRQRMKRKLERVERHRAIERERTRIAKDIHDDLGASLTRITMLSQSARSEVGPSEAATDLDRIYDTARELTKAMDEIVWAVNPKHDTLDSLATYLGRFAQGFLASAHIGCRLDVPMRLPAWPVTSEIRHNLFLAFKEALNNAVKHSGTTEAHISLNIENSGFSLCVEDKGCGFSDGETVSASKERDRASSGNGLINMRQRLAEIGGACKIESSPGQGTTVLFIVPVKIVSI
jgi:signal transduction histidine kinase/ligand-binding sensor domain-containing protein